MNKTVPVSLAPVLILIIAALCVLYPFRLHKLVYSTVRQGAQAKQNYETRQLEVLETGHFRVKYHTGDRKMAEIVAQTAENSYQPVTALVGKAPADKTLIVMHSDKDELYKAFGWTGNQSAMGVYWGGVIQVLAPDVWLKDKVSAEEFMRTGPMVHEFTHLVFDYRTNGNYSRWFTEGLAQYTEYKINGYEWLTPDNTLNGRLFTLDELDAQFDSLDNQSLAYRQSLAAVRYIAEVHGEQALRQVIQSLEQGEKIERAIQKATGLNYQQYEAAWLDWAKGHMNHSGDTD